MIGGHGRDVSRFLGREREISPSAERDKAPPLTRQEPFERRVLGTPKLYYIGVVDSLPPGGGGTASKAICEAVTERVII